MPLRALPHHDGSPLYVSTMAPELGEIVRVKIRVPHGYGRLAAVHTRSNPDHEPEWTAANRIGDNEGWEWWEAPVTVRNPRHGYRFLLRHEDGRVEWLSQSGVHAVETLDAEDFALIANSAPPAWLFQSVMYQVFPDRFARSIDADRLPMPDWAIPASWDEPVDPVMPGRVRQLYGGDLRGVVEHLDHMVDLGVNLLYLTPIFPAASNHRYDASGFDRVDPVLGGDEAYTLLIQQAHARGIRVIGDLTVNHSGDQHEWFLRAFDNPGAETEDYYYFTDGANTSYDGWLGVPSLPKFDWSSRGLRERFITAENSVVARWLRTPFNADGWRIDVANMAGRRGSVDHNAEIRRLIRETVQRVNPDAIVIGESSNDAISDLQGDGWHGGMTYLSFTRPLWAWLSDPDGEEYITATGENRKEAWFFDQPTGGIPRYTARDFVAAVSRFAAGIPWRVRLGTMLSLDTHDTARFANNVDEAMVGVGLGLSMTLPGLPSVFAGDEFGVRGADGEMSRAPMPWGSESIPSVAARRALYGELIQLRRRHPVLGVGGHRWIHVGVDAMAFVREDEDESILVLAARAAISVCLDRGSISDPADAVVLYGAAVLTVDEHAFVLESDGPAFAAWSLPGVVAP